MDYSLTDEQKQIVEAAREFPINESPKLARESRVGDRQTLHHKLIAITGDNISL
ncbi:MAG: hypothetical protein ACLQPD_22165 [Desulfomonilaceae bacterium]